MTDSPQPPRPVPWHRSGSFYLMTAMILTYFVAPVFIDTGARSLVVELLISAIPFFGVRAISRRKRNTYIALAFCIAIFAGNLLFDSHFENMPVLGSYLVLHLFALVTMFAAVVRTETVNADKIFAAVCVYILLGVVFSLAYTIVYERDLKQQHVTWLTTEGKSDTIEDRAFVPERFESLAFHFAEGQTPRAENPTFIYFSFTTLTTLGYGDIYPRSKVTRSLATLEAILGQLYIAIIIARLLALQLIHGRTLDPSKND